MKLKDLIISIKEGNLTKYQLEEYYDQISILYAEMSLDLAEVEKEEAVFLSECEEETRAGAERKWNATEKGLKGIQLKHNLRALSKLGSSLKNRIYNTL